MSPLLPKLMKGYNVTSLAYGITGSGKTYTMLGSGFETSHSNFAKNGVEGISLITIHELFSLLEREKEKVLQAEIYEYEYSLQISYLEVYNERVIDLLSKEKQESLSVLEDPNLGVVIPGLKAIKVSKLEEAVALILMGNERRTMATTHSNQFSSRSHAILQICLSK